MATVHINANEEDIAKLVIMPGDPLRAKFIAETYLKDYKLVNTTRNIYAYTGYYKDVRITVMASGMGNASMGIYSYELYKYYDVDTIIRIGTCGSYKEDLKLNDIIVVNNSYSNSTYGINMGYKLNYIESSEEIRKKIEEISLKCRINIIIGNIHNTDTFYNNGYKEYLDYNCIGVEMETFALFVNAKILNKKASAILTVSDNLITKKVMNSMDREKSTIEMIELVLETIINL